MPAPLNAALVANEEKRTQRRVFRAKVCVYLARFSYFHFYGVVKIVLWFLVWFGSSVSEAALFVESQLCNTVCLKELFGVVSLFSTAF